MRQEQREESVTIPGASFSHSPRGESQKVSGTVSVVTVVIFVQEPLLLFFSPLLFFSFHSLFAFL